MGRYLQQNESRSELQQRIDAELRAKSAAKAKVEGIELTGSHTAPDGVEDSEYIKGSKETTTLAPVWALIVIGIIVVFVIFIYQVSR